MTRRLWRTAAAKLAAIAAAALFAATAAGVAAGCGGPPEPPLPNMPPAPQGPGTASGATAAANANAGSSAASSASSSAIGGSAAALTIIVAPKLSGPPRYDRGEWGVWADADRDCQNARHETLIAESTAPVTFKDGRRCQVLTGRWFGEYTGREFTDASDLDIDHMVPLANAHESGGWRWDKATKVAFSNDLSHPNHLIAVESSANRAKSSKGPEDWRPPRRDYWCQYARDWTDIKARWELTATEREADALADMLRECDPAIELQQIFADSGATQPPGMDRAIQGDSGRTAQTPAPKQPAPDAPLRYDPDGPDRNCSDFDAWEEAQAFYIAAGGPDDDPHRLDRDRDGVACAGLR